MDYDMNSHPCKRNVIGDCKATGRSCPFKINDEYRSLGDCEMFVKPKENEIEIAPGVWVKQKSEQDKLPGWH